MHARMTNVDSPARSSSSSNDSSFEVASAFLGKACQIFATFTGFASIGVALSSCCGALIIADSLSLWPQLGPWIAFGLYAAYTELWRIAPLAETLKRTRSRCKDLLEARRAAGLARVSKEASPRSNGPIKRANVSKLDVECSVRDSRFAQPVCHRSLSAPASPGRDPRAETIGGILERGSAVDEAQLFAIVEAAVDALQRQTNENLNRKQRVVKV